VNLVSSTCALLAAAAVTSPGAAQTVSSVSAADREALVRLRTDRGGRAEEVDALIRQADEVAAKGLPAAPLTNKIREGLAKGHDPKRIELVVRQITTHLETADRLVLETEPSSSASAREASLVLLAESLGSGVTENDVRELRRLAQSSEAPAVSSDALGSAAKALAFIKQANLPMTEAVTLIAEAVRQGYRSHEVLDLGRDVMRRESEYRTGRASLRALWEAIASGARPEQLFREARPGVVERPGTARPEPVERPERPSRPEPSRPERPVRPDRPAARR
jgi:hypothetical protein